MRLTIIHVNFATVVAAAAAAMTALRKDAAKPGAVPACCCRVRGERHAVAVVAPAMAAIG